MEAKIRNLENKINPRPSAPIVAQDPVTMSSAALLKLRRQLRLRLWLDPTAVPPGKKDPTTMTTDEVLEERAKIRARIFKQKRRRLNNG